MQQKSWLGLVVAAIAGGVAVAIWPKSAAAAAPAPACPPCVPPLGMVEPADIAVYELSKFSKTYNPTTASLVRLVKASESQAATIDAFQTLPAYSAADGAAVMAIDPSTGGVLWFRGWDGTQLVVTGDPARVAALSSRRVPG